MSNVTIEVPADLVELFDRQMIEVTGRYAREVRSEADLWRGNLGRPQEDFDGAVNRLAWARQVEVTLYPDGTCHYSGSAWVLSDVADAVLIVMLDKAKEIAFTAPVDYREVAEQAGQIMRWAKRCAGVDDVYRAAPMGA